MIVRYFSFFFSSVVETANNLSSHRHNAWLLFFRNETRLNNSSSSRAASNDSVNIDKLFSLSLSLTHSHSVCRRLHRPPALRDARNSDEKICSNCLIWFWMGKKGVRRCQALENHSTHTGQPQRSLSNELMDYRSLRSVTSTESVSWESYLVKSIYSSACIHESCALIHYVDGYSRYSIQTLGKSHRSHEGRCDLKSDDE